MTARVARLERRVAELERQLAHPAPTARDDEAGRGRRFRRNFDTATADSHDAARMVAARMLMSGMGEEETAAYLADTLGVEDTRAVLDSIRVPQA